MHTVARVLQIFLWFGGLVTIEGWVVSRQFQLGRSSCRSVVFWGRQRLSLQESVVEHEFEKDAIHQDLPFVQEAEDVSSWLICGDGDLSFSASIAQSLSSQQGSGVSLIATVLEDQETHHEVYSNSKSHVETIVESNATACFSIDATRLQHHFPHTRFDRITFNFPHWRGKANNRRNRELLSDFFQSATKVLSSSSSSPRAAQVHVALCQGQGGSTAKTERDWKGSWMAAVFAAEHGLILQSVVVPYQPMYDLSSHRGVDRPFRVGSEPKLYQFGFPNDGCSVEKSLQLCCRHELHIVLQNDSDMPDGMNRQDILEGNAVQAFLHEHKIVPKGVDVDVPLRETLTLDDGTTLAVINIVYRGASIPMTRELADSCRAKLEDKMVLQLRSNRLGRMVSKPFPYSLLPALFPESAQLSNTGM